jgi:hypothetical protein
VRRNGECDYNPDTPMPKQPDRPYKVGDKVSVTLQTGQIVGGTVRAVVPYSEGIKLQVDYGVDETARVELWRVLWEVKSRDR